MIRECIITTLNKDRAVHIAPMGIRQQADDLMIAPFKPSTTLNNLLRSGQAVINISDDVRIFAGCLCGRDRWPTLPTQVVEGERLAAALSHIEVEVVHNSKDDTRPVFYCREKYRHTHAPFMGFNRAKAAVLEGAILVSRLSMLPTEKIDREIAYLQMAIDKTAGDDELLAWGWLLERIEQYRQQEETVL